MPGLDGGEYRVRISGRDRDRGHEHEAAEQPVDAYLVQLWPAPAAPDAILAVGSEDAEYWHRSVGGRR